MKNFLAAVIMFGGVGSTLAKEPPPFATISEARTAIPLMLKIFSTSPANHSLRVLYADITRIPENRKLSTWESDRDFKLASLCGLMVLMDQLRDPHYDPKKVVMSMQPDTPPGADIDSGDSPDSIKDPVIKAQYLALIKEHNEKMRAVILQDDILRIRSECKEYAFRFIKSRYNPKERGDLKRLVENQFKGNPCSVDVIAELMTAITGTD